MKINIAQYYIGTDIKYLELAKLSEQLNKKYAELHKYQYKFLYLDKLNNNFNLSYYENGYQYKLQFILDNLNDCDYLVFLDADAIISNPNFKIEDFIDSTHELFLSRGNGKYDFLNDITSLYNNLVKVLQNNKNEIIDNWHQFIQNYYKNTNFSFEKVLQNLSLRSRYFNEGIFIIKNTEKMKKFFKLCVENIKYFKSNVDTVGMDGRVISFFLHQEEFDKCDTYLSNYIQGHLCGAFENKFNIDKTFILHNYGNCFTIDQKIEFFKQIKNNKHWNKILK